MTFVDAVFNSVEQGTIYYSDIQNYIADAFNTYSLYQTPYFATQGIGRAVFAEVTVELKELAKEIADFKTQLSEGKSEIELSIEKFLNLYRDEVFVKQLMVDVESIMGRASVESSWLQKYYAYIFDSQTDEDYRNDSSIIGFLYQRCTGENLYVKFDADKSSNNILELPSFELPKRYSSLAYNLPSVFTYHLIPKHDGLPRYESIFVYSDTTYMYVLNSVKQYICKGWRKYVQNQSTKYTYRILEYNSFDISEWESYVHSRLSDAMVFVEKTILSFIQ